MLLPPLLLDSFALVGASFGVAANVDEDGGFGFDAVLELLFAGAFAGTKPLPPPIPTDNGGGLLPPLAMAAAAATAALMLLLLCLLVLVVAADADGATDADIGVGADDDGAVDAAAAGGVAPLPLVSPGLLAVFEGLLLSSMVVLLALL